MCFVCVRVECVVQSACACTWKVVVWHGILPEWSKGADLRSARRSSAWVQTPQVPSYVWACRVCIDHGIDPAVALRVFHDQSFYERTSSCGLDWYVHDDGIGVCTAL